MSNPYTGETALAVGGESLTLLYDWRALARLRAELGADGQARALGGDLEALAAAVAIGLAARHPDWDAGRVLAASPPVTPTVKAVADALAAAYFGPAGGPAETGENPRPPTAGTRWSGPWRRLTGRG